MPVEGQHRINQGSSAQAERRCRLGHGSAPATAEAASKRGACQRAQCPTKPAVHGVGSAIPQLRSPDTSSCSAAPARSCRESARQRRGEGPHPWPGDFDGPGMSHLTPGTALKCHTLTSQWKHGSGR